MAVTTSSPEVEHSRAVLTELLLSDQPPRERDPKQTTTGDNALLALADRYGVVADGGLPRGVRTRRRPVQPGHRGRPRRLHPLRPLRPGLRRHPGQRRHRPQRQGLRDADRLRPERPDGRVVLRHLRRVRGGLPDRRADQQADPRRPDPAPHRARRGRQRLPLLRRGLRADLLRRPGTRRDRVRRGPRPAGVAGPPVRQGPLRLGLRGLAAAADDAADPARRLLPEGAAVGGRPRRGGGRAPRPAGPPARRAGAHATRCCRTSGRPRWDEALDLVARRLREIHAESGPGGIAGFGSAKCSNEEAYLFQKLHPHRLRHQQRRPLHAAVPRVQRRGPVRGHRLRRGLHDVRRRRERRRRDRRRQQRHRQPPGRVVLLQAGAAPAARRSSTSTRGPTGSPTTPTSSASSSPAPTSRSTTASCTR